MKRTIRIIMIVALALSFVTTAHAGGDTWQPLIRAASCILSERVPTERMMIVINRYFFTGDVSILVNNGWGTGYDKNGQYYHYFGLKCYKVQP